MKNSIALLALFALSGCEDPLKDGQLLEEPRALGVRLATVNDQASPAPGENAAFEVLLAGPDGSLDARMSYQFCEAAGSTRGVPFCAAPAFAEDTVDLDGSAIPVVIPTELTSDAQLALLAVVCLAS